MRFAAAVSDAEAWGRATDAVVAELQRGLDGARADLVCLFVSPHHEAGWLDVAERVRRELPGALLLGCTARSVLGAGRELEESPGLAALAAALPGVALHPFQLGPGPAHELPGPDDAHVILLVDPFRADLDAWMPALDARFPRGSTLGGVASGAAQPGRNLLFLGEKAARAGAVGVVLTGDLAVDTVVAQGCRPVGPPLFVTGARENVLYELDGQRPLDVLQRIFAAASPAEQRLFAGSLVPGHRAHGGAEPLRVGRLPDPQPDRHRPERRARSRRARCVEGHRVVQFHVRDARHRGRGPRARLLARYREAEAHAPPARCSSRASDAAAVLFGEPDHDSGAFARALGAVPLGGFFCNGEIGPVRGRTFLHGYTSSFGIFRPKGDRP